ncbi:MAG: 4-hydroxy-tetrahydrodipicolinate reductase [Deltaproteobacteria bacterium RIFCSPLOWO2_12_FULL_40_28]|nr:MAG: 4-hydroxy-tetrahydrodipicolinate reductase [Deltaproteobacteria bacterium RIFCSPHIGHO2_02_FULL_40_28]OGQ19061.1 MAG: 4-hydroxy-tetrahydrodipicolinate reductase [Deltaproteobacteria bacterium RIFCSPHIGHO2_12_FULL_40_32]OGQ40233.1 MAG: 4-hydroxy-tetrahydrodipicolinate reductase [Deltaproteobacteria bacterium RIFCSPLOWO2_02_FULL_40_36]OGQ53504.1 MAG: 4-hydroxy-tetrahydrodipicolinate reductase [Deltaproteobacteria bacterium RIFCSPLOWO2_12_FULL_40_28]
MTPVIITGCAGKMGKALIERAKFQNIFLIGATEKKDSPLIGQNIGDVIVSSSLETLLTKKAVVIDFTDPKASLAHVYSCTEKKIPVVIGTTGFTETAKKEIEKAAKNIPIVFSPNMSVGVNLLFKLLSEAASTLSDYDIEIIEAHHRLKKDAPSGTAIGLAKVIAQATKRNYPKDFNFHRQGLTGERASKEIGMQVIRGGDIVGEHTVMFCGTGERVEFKHVATNRHTFADGALKASQWVANQKPGLYSMQNVLGFNPS